MSASAVVRAVVGTMVGTSRRAGVDVGECAGVSGLELELELEGARMAEVTIGGCLILDGEDGVGGDLGRLDVGTQHRTGGNRFCTSVSIFFSFLETFFFNALPYLCLCSMVVSIVPTLLLCT